MCTHCVQCLATHSNKHIECWRKAAKGQDLSLIKALISLNSHFTLLQRKGGIEVFTFCTVVISVEFMMECFTKLSTCHLYELK